MTMRAQYDVAVIGGGHNGLVCAAYLARAGLSVCVLERSDRVGGAAVTEEFHPGFRNSVASYTVGLLQPKVIAELELARWGLSVIPRPLANFVPSVEGRPLKLHRVVERTQAAIAEHSSRDAARYPDFVRELTAVTGLLKTLLLEPPVDPYAGWGERLRFVRLLARVARLGPRQAGAAWELLTGSAGAWLERWFATDALRGALAFDSVVGHFASPYDSGSGYLLLHHCLAEINGIEGAWGHALGGMGAVSDSLAAAARAAGAEIAVEQPVQRVLRIKKGFEVHAGARVMHATTVAAAIHPQLLFTRLIEPELLPSEFLERMRSWHSESASFRVNVALSELPDFSCLPGRAVAEHHAAGILITPSLDYLDRAYLQARDSGYSRAPIVELLIPSTVDDSLAPRGAHVASLFCQHFRRRLPDGEEWDRHEQAALDCIISAVERYAPNFRRAVLAAQVLSPEGLERRFGLIGGDIFHGRMSLDQLYWARPAWGHARYRTPVNGLYLCASGAHPGGGVTGAPGHNAAQVILRDLGRSRRPKIAALRALNASDSRLRAR